MSDLCIIPNGARALIRLGENNLNAWVVFAIVRYFDGEEVIPPPEHAQIWTMIKAEIDGMADAHAKRAATLRKNGAKGGAPKGNRNAVKSDEPAPDKTTKTTKTTKNNQNNQKQPKQPSDFETSRKEKKRKEENIIEESPPYPPLGGDAPSGESFQDEAEGNAAEEAACDEGGEGRRRGIPTLEEVSIYCRDNRFTFSPATFFQYYQANGWRQGNTIIRDWRAVAALWQERERDGTAPRQAAPLNRDEQEAEDIRRMAEWKDPDFKL